jgi:hypothetical protein
MAQVTLRGQPGGDPIKLLTLDGAVAGQILLQVAHRDIGQLTDVWSRHHDQRASAGLTALVTANYFDLKNCRRGL